MRAEIPGLTNERTAGSARGREARFLCKICGITKLEDARFSVELGANCLGINLYPKSPRFMEPRAAAELIDRLPAGVLVVGVVVAGREGADIWRELDDRLDGIQVHGAQSEADLAAFQGRRLLVAVAPADAERFPRHPLIVDTSWGTGTRAPWEEVARIRRPYVLSGGLSDENVAEAIRTLHPAGVDVCSGVERAPGRKDPARLARFLEEVRRCGCLPAADRPGGAAP